MVDKIKHYVATNETCYLSYSRNGLARSFLKGNLDYLMFIDSDMQFPDYGIKRLIERDKDVIGGIYYKKQYPHDPLAFLYDKDENFYTWHKFPQDAPFPCRGLATGFLLIKRKVIEALMEPESVKAMGQAFDLGRNPNSNSEEGEDLAFCRRAGKAGFEVWGDPTISLGHIGKVVYKKDDYDEARQFYAWKTQTGMKLPEIAGFMDPMEMWWLNEQAKKMESIVEIGSWKGRSTYALLSGCKGMVTAVDTWAGNPTDQTGKEAAEKDIHAEFMKNVGHFPNLNVMKMTSAEAAETFDDKSVDMVFIDGDHRYAHVKADIEAWLPKAKRLICGHDYHWIGVEEAVTEKFGLVDTAESIWLKEL
jgi:hypothetical protein